MWFDLGGSTPTGQEFLVLLVEMHDGHKKSEITANPSMFLVVHVRKKVRLQWANRLHTLFWKAFWFDNLFIVARLCIAWWVKVKCALQHPYFLFFYTHLIYNIFYYVHLVFIPLVCSTSSSPYSLAMAHYKFSKV